MKHTTYAPKGTCSRQIDFDLGDDGKIYNVAFTGGCHGNTQGVSRLVEGMDAQEVLSRISGIQCGMRGTSCPDQLSKAIRQALAEA